MEHFIVSARKYRPETFEDVVGQKAITNTLVNAIKNNHLAQALLFTGPRGVGKTTCARILAKQINQQATENTQEDFSFNIFELDAASNNGVDQIRELTDQVRIPPQVGKYKVYIIDEVHMLSQAAFNAFLKTLEEPPKHAIFILATTEKHKIIPTILSRCQIFDFKRITVQDAKEYLANIAKNEGVEAEDDALHIIAQKADGAMRDALSIYDRVVSFSGNKLTRAAVTENLNVLDYDVYFKSTDLILDNNIPELLVQYNEILTKGFDGHHYIAGLASHFRDLLVCKNQATISLLEVGEQTKKKYFEQSQKSPQEILLRGIDIANDCDLKYRSSRNQRLLVELCLMQLASITFDGEKKKHSNFIVPASNFVKIPQQKKEISEASQKIVEEEKVADQATPKTEDIEAAPLSKVEEKAKPSSKTDAVEAPPLPKVEEETKPTPKTEPVEAAPLPKVEEEKPINPVIKKTSGLSLKSIQHKKDLLAQQQAKEKNTVKVESEKFTETQILAAWDEYIQRLKKKGEKILASILETDTPTIEGSVITIELPNSTMQHDLERKKGGLVNYIRKNVRNTSIELAIEVNERAIKKYAFTPREKFEKLKEKNPIVEKLRLTFDLDI